MEGMADVGGPEWQEKCIIISQTSRLTYWDKNEMTPVYFLKTFSYGNDLGCLYEYILYVRVWTFEYEMMRVLMLLVNENNLCCWGIVASQEV